MMQERQTPLLDANGDGTGNDKEDKTLAQDIVIGRGWIPASDMPFIENVSGEQILDGETSATLWAGRVIDANGISRVWAVITPPGFDPGSPDIPIIDLPTVELQDPDRDGIYKGVYADFTLHCTYNIAIYAMDTEGVYSLPKQTTVVQTKGVAKGDINGDGSVNLADTILALQVLVGLEPSTSVCKEADVNEDGRIGLEDVIYILQKAAELR